jgi:ketosteroid isomerase-like protein
MAERDGRELHVHCYRMLLRVAGGKIAEITTFGATLFDAFGLPPTL